MFNGILTLLSAGQIRAFYAAGFWRDDTIYRCVSGHASADPDRPAIRDRGRRISRGELVATADRLAADLEARGVRPGDRVAVWLPSRIETAAVLLACSRNGYLCCPSLHRDHTTADIEDLLRRMRAAALIAQSGYGADAHRHAIFERTTAIPSLRAVYRLDAVGAAAPAAVLLPDAGLPPSATPPRNDPDTIVYLPFTSGTTGVPKGVMHSDNTLLANARVLAADWHIKDDAVVYSLSPLSHNLGFGALVLALAHGGEFVCHDLPRGASLVDRVLDVDATFMIGVPTHAVDLLDELRARNLERLGRVKGFRISGAAVAPVVASGLLDHGVVPQSGYGMTEAGSHHYTRPDDTPARMTGTSGRAAAGYEIKVFSQQDRDVEVPPGEIGEIGGRGASLMLGYFGDQQATESAFNCHGWFMTGDLGRVDADGYLHVTGRKKDVIIRGGHNIHPARIEALAMRHAGVAATAVVPVDDDRLGEKACLAVVPRQGHEVKAIEMLRHLDDAGLSRFDMPEYFVCLEKLPLTANGKVLKRELAETIRRGGITPEPVRFAP